MLILTRRIGESLVVGDKEIIVTILGIKGNQIKIGIEAPKNVSVHREEIFMRIKDALENELHERDEAAQVQEGDADE